MSLIDLACYLLPLLAIFSHLLAAPYTKVEESFSLQATHDILRYGLPTKNVTAQLTAEYDHLSFPGAVPRSFVGPLVLAGLSKPFIAVLGGVVNEQVIVRGVIGLLTALSLSLYIHSVRRAYGPTTARFYTLLQLCQFHLPFYASRTLPNTFALILSITAQSFLLPSPTSLPLRQSAYRRVGLYLLTFTAIVFRSEVVILLAFHTIHLLITRRISVLHEIIPAGIAGAAIGLTLTLGLDSYFWQSQEASPIFSTPVLTEKLGLLWPEFSAFWFNAVEQHASDWGESPWHYYFTSALPKLLLNPTWTYTIPMGLMGMPRAALDLMIPSLGYTVVYSLLAHKEWRFIIYVVPSLTLISALGSAWIWNRRQKSRVNLILSLVLLMAIPATHLISTGMLGISAMNYPGGHALSLLHRHLPAPPEQVKVHLDVPVCMTGATRFLQEAPLFSQGAGIENVAFDKTEDEDTLLMPGFWQSVDYAVMAAPEKAIGKYTILERVSGFKKIRVYRPGEIVKVRPISVPEEATAEAGLADEKAEEPLDPLERVLTDGFGLRSLLRGWWVGIEREEMVFVLKRQDDWSEEV